MKLFAISDLHVGFPDNREALSRLRRRPEDWLILAGDLGETEDHLRFVIDTLGPRFAKLLWVPGNHELWTPPEPARAPRGEERYQRLVEICRASGVLTPEDPYPIWQGEGGEHLIVPLFLLYDYSFRPSHVPEEAALEWAAESGVICADEMWLKPDPHPSRKAWCDARLALSLGRLEEAPELPTVLINHFPLREELVRLRRIPRFSLWCGTRRTHDWHRRFRASVVVYGHLHTPSTDIIEGTRFEEVSFGYPKQRWLGNDIERYLRQILPGDR